MPVIALHPDYPAEVVDGPDAFHGNHLLYIGWDRHSMICAPICLPLPPSMPFAELLENVLPGTVFAEHPDWPHVDWSRVEWIRDGEAFTPRRDASLADNGIGHKSFIRMRTPELHGIAGSES